MKDINMILHTAETNPDYKLWLLEKFEKGEITDKKLVSRLKRRYGKGEPNPALQFKVEMIGGIIRNTLITE